MKYRLTIIFFFSFFNVQLYSQSPKLASVDSILNLANTTRSKQKKCTYFNEIAGLLSDDNPKESIFYAEKANQLVYVHKVVGAYLHCCLIIDFK